MEPYKMIALDGTFINVKMNLNQFDTGQIIQFDSSGKLFKLDKENKTLTEIENKNGK